MSFCWTDTKLPVSDGRSVFQPLSTAASADRWVVVTLTDSSALSGVSMGCQATARETLVAGRGMPYGHATSGNLSATRSVPLSLLFRLIKIGTTMATNNDPAAPASSIISLPSETEAVPVLDVLILWRS